MSYTFGGATSDDIVFSTPQNFGVDNGSVLVAGWWYPTTLTATRGYWSGGNTFGAEVDGTTSEIRMRTDNTTDGQWVTSGAGITVDKWWFIAWLNATENTTVAGDWRVWVGDQETPPVEVSVSNPTARSGNYSGGANFYAGNKGTQTLSFQGDIDWVTCMCTNTVGVTNLFNIATSGVISNDDADFNYRRWVHPLWAGNPSLASTGALLGGGGNWFIAHCELGLTPVVYRRSHATGATDFIDAPTINGATYTSHAAPRRPPFNWPHLHPYVRR